MQVFYHRLGTKQADDLLIIDPIVAQHDPKWMTHASMSNDGQYVVFSVHKGTEPVNKLYYFDLAHLPERRITAASTNSQPLAFVRLVDDFAAEYRYKCC